MSDKFHDKSKEAGNKLKENILTFSSVATGVFFISLTDKDVSSFSSFEKGLLLGSISFFSLTVVLCLLELYVDSRRFFHIAKQIEKPEIDQNWAQSKKLKKLRVNIIYASYFTVIIGSIIAFIYMVQRVA